jgi:2,3-bisphosphoglycerate-independent phosphoglycerate mutase
MSYEKKHIMIIMDGAGDVYRDDKGRSPLRIAYTPYIEKQKKHRFGA